MGHGFEPALDRQSLKLHGPGAPIPQEGHGMRSAEPLVPPPVCQWKACSSPPSLQALVGTPVLQQAVLVVPV